MVPSWALSGEQPSRKEAPKQALGLHLSYRSHKENHGMDGRVAVMFVE